MESITQVLQELEMSIHKTPEDAHTYVCEKCKDKGIIPVNVNGYIMVRICKDCERKRKLKKWLSHSGISSEDYSRYTLDNFLEDTDEACKMKRVALSFIHDPDAIGLGYFGASGTGKTHICIAVCQAVGTEHHYWQYRNEIQKLKNSMYRSSETYDELMRIPKTSPCLYIDDLFKGAYSDGGIDKQDLQIVFDIINTRYIKRLPTIISSEYSLNAITKADTAIGSRIYSMCYPYLMRVDGRNRRLQRGVRYDVST